MMPSQPINKVGPACYVGNAILQTKTSLQNDQNVTPKPKGTQKVLPYISKIIMCFFHQYFLNNFLTMVLALFNS